MQIKGALDADQGMCTVDGDSSMIAKNGEMRVHTKQDLEFSRL